MYTKYFLKERFRYICSLLHKIKNINLMKIEKSGKMKKNENKEMVNPNVALPLSKRNKTFVTLASGLFMFYIAAHGTALAISQSFILAKIDGMSFFSLSAILIALGAAIMTPIGGKLGDIIGRKTLIFDGYCWDCSIYNHSRHRV